MFVSQNEITIIYSVSLKVGAFYITDQWGEFIRKMLLNAFIYFFLVFFVVFHYKICVFIYFFDEVLDFRNRILTNQKHVLVVSNWQRNCMQSKNNMKAK